MNREYTNNDRYEFTDDNLDDWYTKIDDDFKPDKRIFIETRFAECYGEKLDFETINKLVSRSSNLAEWYANQNLEYILEIDVPRYYADKISSSDYKLLSNDVSEYNELNRLKSLESQKLAERYKKDVKSIEMTYKPKFDKILDNDYVRILTLSSDQLPLGIQLKIEKYTPQDNSDPRTSALYSREMLVRYKIELLEAAKRGENIEKLINERQTKF